MRSSGAASGDGFLGGAGDGLQARVVVEDALALLAIDDEQRGPLLKEAAAFAIDEAGERLDAHAGGGNPGEERLRELQSGRGSGRDGGHAGDVEGDAADVVGIAVDRRGAAYISGGDAAADVAGLAGVVDIDGDEEHRRKMSQRRWQKGRGRSAVEPAARFTGGTPFEPEPLGAPPAAGTSRFMCCEPAARAMESLVQVLKRKATVASTVARTCICVVPGVPVTRSPNLLADLRVKFSIQPREIHGAGGASTEKRPLTRGIEEGRRLVDAIDRGEVRAHGAPDGRQRRQSSRCAHDSLGS